ncbi:hypothetical protein RKD23_004561 [Streptomyces sp. SAI-170]|uniref:spore-associated protein A n=1 Tax=Streptomyces sp. SAI-170 TaxID=3377729 RepID=UPI003C7E3217
MITRNRIAGCAAALALTVAGLVVTATPAQAAGYNGACGSGYSVIDSMRVGGTNTEGTTYLTYNSSNGYNCVVTMNNTGATRWVGAEIEVSGGDWISDSGQYRYYAGPVYVYAANRCIDWGGGVSYYAGLWDVKWNDHCG